MVTTTLYRELPLSCPACGSTEAALTYTAPVHVVVRDRDVVSVTLDDESSLFAGAALCGICGRSWRLSEEPENGVWSAWDVGP